MAITSSWQQGLELHRIGRLEAAEQQYRSALAASPDDANLLQLLGSLCAQQRRHQEAVHYLQRAIALNCNEPLLHHKLAQALLEAGHYREVVAVCDNALAAFNGHAGIWYCRGRALQFLQLPQEAAVSHEAALRNSGSMVGAWIGLGVARMMLDQREAALDAYDNALQQQPDNAAVLANKAQILTLCKRHREAVDACDRALALDASVHYLRGLALTTRLHVCDWRSYHEQRQTIISAIAAGSPACMPQMLPMVCDDPALQLVCARNYMKLRYGLVQQALWKGERYRHAKVRVAYVSSDFHSHATAFLMAELFELHDRQCFEWYAFSFGPERDGEMRKRLERAFDHFENVAHLSDLELARRIRASEIDIVVDLKGHTLHGRPGIFSYRPAPLQVNYLGYPGTIGADWMDYVLVDRVLVPAGDERHYSEQVVCLPHSYQVNDRQRRIADQRPERSAVGLPATGFVFCCFNNNYKIMPDVFAVWMRLLLAVDGSVLWLLQDNPESAGNLRSEAAVYGVAPERLVFADRCALPEHLARHGCADLFLDTLPCNAHTTASDALWAGLPLLTCTGRAFASRVAASLLHAIGLPELVTGNLQQYEHTALELARNPDQLAALRQKLDSNRLTTPLFDSGSFCKHLESAYQQMYQRHEEGLPPAGFEVGSATAIAPATPGRQAAEAHLHNGHTWQRAGSHAEAIDSYSLALAFDPFSTKAMFARGNSLTVLESPAAALADYELALSLNPQHPALLNNKAGALLLLRRYEEALESCQQAVAILPGFVDAWCNCGYALNMLQRHREVEQCYQRALHFAPDSVTAWTDLGVVRMGLNQPEAALACYEKALTLNPRSVSTLQNLSQALARSKRYSEAVDACERALTINANANDLPGYLLHFQQQICDWRQHDERRQAVIDGVKAGRSVIQPFGLMSVCDEAQVHLECARIFVRENLGAEPTPLWRGERYRHTRLRVGYVSADFHSHAVATLVAELFELHDRSDFECYAFSFGPRHGAELQQRIEAAFEHFEDAGSFTDLQLAQRIRACEIDIVVDLMGYTMHSRPAVFSWRPAPVQVGYLGFPGTTGARWMDYILVDAVLVPAGDEVHYSEQVVRLPDTYMANDRQRPQGLPKPARGLHGLPTNRGFVFCCFNNGYKITPEFFAVWMRLLTAVEGSVLWLLSGTLELEHNLRSAAAAHSVNPQRLVFAPRGKLPTAEHMARFHCADLFLDTLPYNAHTTASEALWAGLPLLTCIGRTFAGRVAASLLHAIGLPELVTANLAEYEQRALELARNPGQLAALRQKLDSNRLTTPLFDSVRFTRHLEAAYRQMHEQSGRGLPPEGFDVARMM